MLESARDTLRSAGLKRTRARVSVLSVIEAGARPLRHADLVAHPTLAGIDDITLYRTLAALERAHLVHGVRGIDGAWRYCAQPRQRPGCPGNHAHFLCGRCGAMSCLVDEPMPRVSVPRGAVVETRQFLAIGRCARCASPAKKRAK